MPTFRELRDQLDAAMAATPEYADRPLFAAPAGTAPTGLVGPFVGIKPSAPGGAVIYSVVALDGVEALELSSDPPRRWRLVGCYEEGEGLDAWRYGAAFMLEHHALEWYPLTVARAARSIIRAVERQGGEVARLTWSIVEEPFERNEDDLEAVGPLHG